MKRGPYRKEGNSRCLCIVVRVRLPAGPSVVGYGNGGRFSDRNVWPLT